MTVRQLMAGMDARELSEWYALYRLEAEEREESQRQQEVARQAQAARAKAGGRG